MGSQVNISQTGRSREDAHDLSLLVTEMGEEIFAVATAAQAREYFLAVGRRMAAHADMTDVTNITTLTARINVFWGAMGWGSARVAMTGDGLAIHHTGMPPLFNADAEARWSMIGSALLEGTYDSWLRSVGSGPALKTRVIEWRAGTVELLHGR
jgi:hypothetical protein